MHAWAGLAPHSHAATGDDAPHELGYTGLDGTRLATLPPDLRNRILEMAAKLHFSEFVLPCLPAQRRAVLDNSCFERFFYDKLRRRRDLN